MRLDKYIPEGQYWHEIADIRQAGIANILLGAIEAKRDEVRQQLEHKPQICDDDVTKDMRFKAGAVWALNWVLSLPEEARKHINQLPGI